jgi:hypothetical protein
MALFFGRGALMALVVALSSVANAQPVQDPYPVVQTVKDPRLRIEMEKTYADYLRSCGLPEGLKRNKYPKRQVSSIDLRIRDMLRLHPSYSPAG